MENEILYRYLKNETSEAEERQIEAWLEAAPEEHQKQLDGVRFLFEAAELHGAGAAAAPLRIRPTWRRIVRYGLSAAAAVLVVLGAGHGAYRRAFREMSDMMQVVQVPAGQRMELTLADGTHIWLNSEARLEYPVVFAPDTRSVRLSGEAMFQVAHDESHPFVVETFASNVRVLGTKFNINADEEHRRFSTTLLEGSVLLTNRLDPAQGDIVMKPDEVVSLKNDRLKRSPLLDETSLCWMDGLIYVTDLSFLELMDKFEQAFAVKIVIERDTLPDMRGTGGKIRVNAGIENALRVLQYGTDFTYRLDEATNTVIIR